MNKQLVDLGVNIALKRPAENFSTSDMEGAFKTALAEKVVGADGRIDYYAWEQHKIEIFAIMSEILTEIEPKKVMAIFDKFAEIKRVPEGTKARFLLKRGVRNVKRFVTRVALAGEYERVRLDRDYIDVDTYPHGGAIYQTMEGFLSGRESLTELLEIFMDELENALYDDIMTVILGLEDAALPNNKASGNAFDAAEFNKVLNTVSAYGTPVIFTTRAFAQNYLLPASSWVSDVAMEEMRNQGYLGRYMGSDVVVLEQSFTDPSNTTKVLLENFAFIMPAGSNERPIKVSLEGDVKIREANREDWSKEMQIYRKAGISVLNTNHIGFVEINPVAGEEADPVTPVEPDPETTP